MHNILRPHTLASIAEAHGVNKRATQAWLRQAKEAEGGEVGEIVGKTRYFSDEERDILLQYAGEPRAKTTQTEVLEPLSIETENHCNTLAKPDLEDVEFSLERFRADDVEALMFENPGSVADQFITVADRLVEAMDADIYQREQRLKATKDAQGKVAAKAQDLKLEQRLYRDRARDLDTAQNSETAALQDAVEALQDLGKPKASSNETEAA